MFSIGSHFAVLQAMALAPVAVVIMLSVHLKLLEAVLACWPGEPGGSAH